MIRPGTESDFPACVGMSGEFWKHTAYTDPFDPVHVGNMVRKAWSHRLLYVLELDGVVRGFTAGIAIPLLGNGQVVQVTELAFWIDQGVRGRHGLVLLSALEHAARSIGAKYLNMIAMESSDPAIAEMIYLRRGFDKIETTYRKQLLEG